MGRTHRPSEGVANSLPQSCLSKGIEPACRRRSRRGERGALRPPTPVSTSRLESDGQPHIRGGKRSRGSWDVALGVVVVPVRTVQRSAGPASPRPPSRSGHVGWVPSSREVCDGSGSPTSATYSAGRSGSRSHDAEGLLWGLTAAARNLPSTSHSICCRGTGRRRTPRPGRAVRGGRNPRPGIARPLERFRIIAGRT